MDNEKMSGSYYTPKELVRFMIDYLREEKRDFERVLEPSAGDGRFLPLLLPLAKEVDAVELFKEKTEEIRGRYQEPKLHVKQADFLDFALKSKSHYTLIIGNPPYISPKLMEKPSLTKARKLCEMEGLDKTAMQNMWLAFVVGACRLLLTGGTIFFVLPMEFLQVQYAEKLRIYLEEKFNTIHIVVFKKRIFLDIEQEVCLVYLTNKEKCPSHILYKVYENADQRKPIVTNVIKKNKPLKKWANAILSDGEISLLKTKKSGYKKVDDMGVIAPGIVTGGNKYFILSESAVERYQCKDYVLPILQKSSYITEARIDINPDVMKAIQALDKPMFLLDLAKTSEQLPAELDAYLERIGNEKIGENFLKDRYKCANRTPWYGVPIVNKGQVIFFKRYDFLPKVYINDADIHTTDAGYHIRLKPGFEKESFVFCFYNSLTLALCEYNGRYYGGGVRELVPSEFKDIVVPYREIEEGDIAELKRMFQRREKAEQIISFVDSKTLSEDMSEYEISELQMIRLKLMGQRNKC